MTPAVVPHQTAYLRFGRLAQEKGERHTLLGELTQAGDVTRVKDGPLEKRPGFLIDQDVTFSGSPMRSHASPQAAVLTYDPESVLPGDGSNLLVRDVVDNAFLYDSEAKIYRDRGTHRRVYPTTTALIPEKSVHACPIAIEVGADTWTFSLAEPFDPALPLTRGSYGYRLVITDTTTGVTKYRIFTEADAAGTVLPRLWSAAYDGTYVWLLMANPSFGGKNDYDVRCHRITVASPTTAPTATTYYTSAGFETITQIAMRRLSAISETAVVILSLDTTGNAVRHHSYLDPATGQPKGAPAAVVSNLAMAGQVWCNTGLSILISDGATSWYYAYWRGTGGGAATASLLLIAVNSTTLAVSSTTTLVTKPDTVDTRGFGATCGYVDTGTGNRVVFGQYDAASTQRQDEYQITRYTYTGSAATTQVVAYNAWIASQPALYSGTWYFLTGYNDVAVSPVTYEGLQRTLFLRNSDGRILAVINYAQGPAPWHNGYNIDINGAASGASQIHMPPMFASGAALYAAIAQGADVDGYTLTSLLKVDMAPTFAKPVQVEAKGVAPGAVPATWSKESFLSEVAPILFPAYIRRTAGAAADVTALAAVYRITDRSGNITRSAPVIVTGSFGAGDTVEVPIPSHRIHNGVPPTTPSLSGDPPTNRIEIEVYAGSTELSLQGTVLFDALQPGGTATMNLPTPIKSGTEILYTTGGALSNGPAPPSRAVAQWDRRVFFASGTRVQYSQELATGFGPALNEGVLAFEWKDGTGDILGMMPVSSDYLALFKINAIAVIQAGGPDGRGQGNYVPRTISTRKGVNTSNLGSLVTGPQGCYFNDSQGGRLCCVTTALEVVEAARGGYDSATEVNCLAAIHAEPYRQMWFLLENSGILAVNYQYPKEGAAFGEVYTWGGQALVGSANDWQGDPLAACLDSSGPVILDAFGLVRRPDATVGHDEGPTTDVGGTFNLPILMTLQGYLQPANLQGEFDVSALQVLATYVSNCTVLMYARGDLNTPTGNRTKAVTGDPVQLVHRPANCARIQRLFFEIDIVTSTALGRDVKWEGFALEYQPLGRMKQLNTTQVI